MVRVYCKNGQIAVHPIDEKLHNTLLKEGWVHTETMEPARWIEQLCNESIKNISCMIHELRNGPIVFKEADSQFFQSFSKKSA